MGGCIVCVQQRRCCTPECITRPFSGAGTEKDFQLISEVFGHNYLYDWIVAGPDDLRETSIKNLTNEARKHVSRMHCVPYSEAKPPGPVDMPDDMIEKILPFIPLTKAYAISRFSKRFKDAWRFCRDVSLDKEFFTKVGNDELVKAIAGDIIMGHSGSGA